MSDALDFLAGELEALSSRDLRRELVSLHGPQGATVTLASGETLLSFCSNDYLGLAADPRLADAAAQAARTWGAGAGASRLVVGNLRLHETLEAALAAHVGLPAALLFTSGYAANVGTIAALAGPGDRIVSDALNHASLIDGARLSRAEVVVVPHADPEAVDRALSRPARRRIVITDSVFSMDGDVAPLPELRAACDRHGAILYVDEAHAVGVLGDGAGAARAAGVVPDVLVGTLGKALGAGGAFVAGPLSLRAWLVHKARSFVFSTGLVPPAVAAAQAGLSVSVEEPWRRERVLAHARRFAAGLRALGWEVPEPASPIVPLVLGEPSRAVAASAALLAQGILVRPIRPPTVPEGTSRLRFSFSAAHDEAQVDRVLAALGAVRRAA